MAKISVLIVLLTFILSLIASTKSKYCKHDDSAMKRFIDRNTAITGTYLYERLVKFPKQSYSIVTLPVYCIVAHLAYHAKGDDYEKLLEFMNLRDEHEMREVLSAAVSQINYKSDTSSKLTFKVYGDHNQEFTRSYKNDFIDICQGQTGYLDYNCPEQALKKVNEWFEHQSTKYNSVPTTSNEMFDRHDKNAVYYATYMDFIASFDDEANPNAIIDIDFEVGHNKTLKFPSLYGNGYFKYAKLPDLDAEVIQMRLKGGKHFAVFYYPCNVHNLEHLMKKLQDPEVFYGGLERAEWQCLKIHITIGHAEVSNDLFEFVPELCLNSTRFDRVFKSGHPAHVNYGFQALNLYGDREVRKGQLNSKWCPSKNLPFVKMNHACAYYVIDSNGMNVYAGVIHGPQNYST
ncbi:alaserpin-like [Manduca sexta]|uniref:alaserpin-like n=1 Tax=Manduca sexta TaxID=7130 RepID=UPI00188F0B15|nr:alaserpin-like [Manduca sexta]